MACVKLSLLHSTFEDTFIFSARREAKWSQLQPDRPQHFWVMFKARILFVNWEFHCILHRIMLMTLRPDCHHTLRYTWAHYVAHEQSDPTFTLGSIIYMHTCILYILWSDLIMQSKQTRQLYLCSLYLLLPLLQREFIFYFKWSKQEKRWQGLSSLDMLFLWGSSERRPCWWCFKSHWGVLMEKWW